MPRIGKIGGIFARNGLRRLRSASPAMPTVQEPVVEPLLRAQLALPGKWRAIQVREQLAPVARKIIEQLEKRGMEGSYAASAAEEWPGISISGTMVMCRAAA